jgi:hypothetical protein
VAVESGADRALTPPRRIGFCLHTSEGQGMYVFDALKNEEAPVPGGATRSAIGYSEMCMKRLILTTDSSGAGTLMQAGIADIVIPLGFRFTSGPLPSDADLANSLATRSAKGRRAVPYWLNDTGWRNEKIRRKGL